MEATIIAVIGLIQAVSVAIIGGLISRSNNERKARDDRADEREEKREKRDLAIYELLFANTDGTMVLLHQAHGDHLNGNVEKAMKSIDEAKKKFNDICNEEVVKL